MDFLKLFSDAIGKFFGKSEELTASEAHAELEKVAAGKTFAEHLEEVRQEGRQANEALSGKITALEGELVGLKATISEKDERISALEVELATERQNVQAAKTAHESETAQLNQKIASLTARNATQNDETQEVESISIGTGNLRETVHIVKPVEGGALQKLKGKK